MTAYLHSRTRVTARLHSSWPSLPCFAYRS